MITGVEAQCMGQTLLGAMTGPAEDVGRSVPLDLLCSPLLAMHLIQRLGPYFGADSLSSSFLAWEYLGNYKRSEGGMKDYLCQWDIRSRHAASLSLEIPPHISGMILLSGAGLSQDQLTRVHSALGTNYSSEKISLVLTRCLGHSNSHSLSSTFLANSHPTTNPRPAKPKPQGAWKELNTNSGVPRTQE